ncbi:TPA: LysR family transcriptional regulator [Escherichia coli]
MGEISVKTGNNARNGGKNSLNRLIRCVCGKKIGPDPRNFNQRVSLGRNDLLIRTFPNNVLARVEQIGRGEAGRIELGVVGTAMWGRMRPVMRRFLRENPNVEVLFREKMPAMQMALLERRELDAGIWRMATEPPTGFTSLRLHESAFLVAMPEEHHLSSFSTVPLEALRDEYFVTMPPVYTDWDFLQRVCQQVGFSPVVIREVNEPQTVLAMVSMGIGITLIADSYAQMNWPGVIFRPLKQRIPADLYIVYETQQVTPAMVKLLAALTQ